MGVGKNDAELTFFVMLPCQYGFLVLLWPMLVVHHALQPEAASPGIFFYEA